MILLILRLWPALIPLVLYAFWHHRRAQKHRAAGEEAPAFFNGPWVKAFMLSLFIAAMMLILWRVMETDVTRGAYEPARIENGKVIKSQIIQR